MGGVSEPTPGKGKKDLNVELNLVPFIDLMTVCVTFLLLTAVWTQTTRINIDQSVAKPQPKQEQKEPPKRLTIVVDQAGYTVKWADQRQETFPKVDSNYNEVALREHLEKLIKDEAEKLPKDQKVIVAPEDKVAYKDMVQVMDVCIRVGLPNIMVADAASAMAGMM